MKRLLIITMQKHLTNNSLSDIYEDDIANAFAYDVYIRVIIIKLEEN